MNKGIKTIVLSLLIISCIICIPAYGKEKKQKEDKPKYTPKNSRLWIYDDDTKAYEKARTYNRKINIHEASYTSRTGVEGPDLDYLFAAPGGRYSRFHNPDDTVGINYIKRISKYFE